MIKYHGIKSLAEKYAKTHNVSIREAEETVKNTIEVLQLGLSDSEFDGIQFVDILTLKRVVRKESLGRNPKTKIEYIIPKRLGIKAILGKNFSRELNG